MLLISALLTAGYLLPITISGFFPGEDFDYGGLKKREPGVLMTLPIALLTALSVLAGLFPNVLTDFIARLAADIL